MLKQTGRCYILEGIDGTGKTTQCDILASKLGCKCLHLPYYDCSSGQDVKNYIPKKKQGKDELKFQRLCLMNMIWFFEQVVKPEIEAGRDVVISRGLLSMGVYGLEGLSHIEDEKELEECTKKLGYMLLVMNSMLYDSKIPCIYILLDLPVNESLKRIQLRGELHPQFETKERLTFCRKHFKNFDVPVVNVKGKTIEEVAKEIEDLVSTHIEELEK